MSIFCCFKSCRPRYVRLVDNIFPGNPSDGIVRSEMEKLTYYALSAPEKLHRIGTYLSQILGRDIARRRDGSVYIAMEALNQLLLACHAQQINLFVESFLKMVATLLESNNVSFQVLGTESFVKFSKIEEDTASYHRRYDFFVSKFSAMCHNHDKDMKNRLLVRLHGVRGLQGVIRKTVSDELQVNIWEKQHMDKIVPSLLINMQSGTDDFRIKELTTPSDEQHPAELAEQALRELLSKASFATLVSVLDPALDHLDTHKLWTPNNEFAIKAFKVIMYSVQSQYSHLVVKSLLDHLAHKGNSETIQCSILDVLCAIVPIPSSAALGPSVIDVFNMLSQHLHSIATAKSMQLKFKESLIKTTGIFGEVIPDYQKLEALTFYMNKAKTFMENSSLIVNADKVKENSVYVSLLLQCIVKISEPYKSANLSSISSSLTDPLFKLSLMLGPTNRGLSHDVLLVLFDKHNNRHRFKIADSYKEILELGLEPSSATKYDKEFLTCQLPSIANFLIESFLLEDNTKKNLIQLCQCLTILSLSAMSPELLVDVCRIMLAVQATAVDHYTVDSKYLEKRKPFIINLLEAVGCCFLFIAHFSSIPEFQDYVSEVIRNRRQHHVCLLPSGLLSQATADSGFNANWLQKDILFTSDAIEHALRGRSGFPRDKLAMPMTQHRFSQVDNRSVMSVSVTDVDSININVDPNSEESVQLRQSKDLLPASAITFKYLKQTLYKPTHHTDSEQMNKKKLAEHYKTATFEQLLSELPPNPSEVNQQYLNNLFLGLSSREVDPIEEGGIDDWDVPSLLQY